MKSKYTKYTLIVSLVLVWGTIAYKISDYIHSDESYTVQENTIKPIAEQDIKKDSFLIMANYRDPFLGRTIISYTHSIKSFAPKEDKNLKPKVVIEKPQPPTVNWPKLNYNGIIINQKSKNQTGILKINSKDILIHQGDMVFDLEIVRLFNDSVVVKYSGQVKTIIKTK